MLTGVGGDRLSGNCRGHRGAARPKLEVDSYQPTIYRSGFMLSLTAMAIFANRQAFAEDAVAIPDAPAPAASASAPSAAATIPTTATSAADTPATAPSAADATPAAATPATSTVEQTGQKAFDNVKNFQNSIRAGGKNITDRLNDNPWSRAQYSGTLDGYDWKLSDLRFAVEPALAMVNRHPAAGLRTEADAMDFRIEQKTVMGSDERTYGLHAEFTARRDLATNSGFDFQTHGVDLLNPNFVGPRVEVYERWKRDGDTWHVSSTAAVGGSQNEAMHGANDVYVRGVQEAVGGTAVHAWFGAESRLKFRLEEGIEMNSATHTASPYYRMTAVVQKPFAVHFHGKEHRLGIEFGLEMDGTRQEPHHLGPRIRIQSHY